MTKERGDHAAKPVKPSVLPQGDIAASSALPLVVQNTNPFAIVAIGASAGGLDACRAFLKALPPHSSMAFIFVQHLGSAHHSLIVDLLKSHTGLTVQAAKHGVALEPDHFYVIAPGTYLTVEHGLLHVQKPAGSQHIRLPFDRLLHSLAKDVGPRAICIILSGTGADGSDGLIAIKQNGGLVLVQEPESAAYDGMPQNAMMTGMVDQILAISAMPQVLALHKTNASWTKTDTDNHDLTPENARILNDIITLVHLKTMHDFRHYKKGTLKRRVERRMGLLAIAPRDYAGYLACLRADETQVQSLFKDLLINVTGFFRDRSVFALLEQEIVPNLVKAHPPERPIRVWIAGCSSGEEAYSFAMLFCSAIQQFKPGLKLQIFASDIDGDAIATARLGFYPHTIAADIGPEKLARYFIEEDNGYRIKPDLRAMVVFSEQDVLTDPPFSRIDLISCRNLLIYLAPEAQAKVIALFHFALCESGLLLLGAAETVGNAARHFQPLAKSERLYRHIGKSRPGALLFSLGGMGPPNINLPLGPKYADETLKSRAAPNAQSAIADLCQAWVMKKFAPPVVLINQKYELIYALGSTHRFLSLPTGQPSLDIFSMLPKVVQTKLRSAMQRASQSEKTVITTPSARLEGEQTLNFTMHVEPIMHDDQRHFLICFVDEPAGPTQSASKNQLNFDENRMRALEDELEATKIELNGAIRNLEISSAEQKAINEEGASFNEEYQSTNEELLTSKEELQSLNEELTALNGQLQETLEKQKTAANDLQNVLYSTAVATLFLDPALHIRFFTPATTALFKLIPGDIGRPLADLSLLAADANLLSDALHVLENHKPLEHEIESTQGPWYRRRILPYLGEQNRVEGVVITFVDITEQRHHEEALQAAKLQADLANAAKSRFLAAASHDLRQPLQTLSLLQGMLVRAEVDEKSRNLLIRFGESLTSMAAMLNALLDINQIEAGIIKADMTDFALQTLFSALRDDFTLIAEAKNLAFRVVNCAAIIHTDPQLLGQMLRNLLSNAFKYTQTGKVLLGCRRKGKTIRIEIWDSGIGIPDSELTAIFDEYHQLNNDARMATKGLGLGLSIVQRLGVLLGQSVSVKSRLAKGSVFTIEAKLAEPITGKMAGKALRPASGANASTAKPLTIMLIEDDPDLRAVLSQLLHETGHTVHAADNGPTALAMVTEEKCTPDIILADYTLPGGMNGMQTIKNMRQILHNTCPALILTGDISSKTLNDVTGPNIMRLAKPVQIADVEHAMQALAQNSKGPQSVAKPAALLSRAPPVPPTAAEGSTESALVYIIDDDETLLDILRLAIEKHGHRVQTFASCEAYLSAPPLNKSGCLLVDGYLPGMNGIDLLHLIKQSAHPIASIMMTGKSDVPMVIEAMKAGAADFIEKPIEYAAILQRIDAVLDNARDENKQSLWHAEAAQRIGLLTKRQKQIMDLVLAGQPSKNIAADLHISQRTVENHRAAIMHKTGIKSLPALARLALAAQEMLEETPLKA